MAFAVLFPATAGPIVVIPALSSFAFLTRITAAAAIVGWFAVWFVWLIPWMARLCYRDFLDDLVADYVVQPAVEKNPSSRADVTAAAK